MILRKTDITPYAHSMGIWEALCEVAGIEPDPDNDEQEIHIVSIEGEE